MEEEYGRERKRIENVEGGSEREKLWDTEDEAVNPPREKSVPTDREPAH